MLQVQMFSYSNTIDRQVDMQEGINKWLYNAGHSRHALACAEKRE